MASMRLETRSGSIQGKGKLCFSACSEIEVPERTARWESVWEHWSSVAKPRQDSRKCFSSTVFIYAGVSDLLL